MSLKKSIKKNLASEHLFCKIWGALLKRWWLLLLVLLGLVLSLVQGICNCFSGPMSTAIESPWCHLVLLTLGVWLSISVCHTLADIFNLCKQENGITWCQISILIAIGVWILGFLLIFNIQKDNQYFIVLGIVGTLITFIFQDALKGVVAFVHLRLNHLLCIDDWIKVPQYNIDGEVKRVTLTTVTVYNWDTTTGSFPISALYSGYFENFQKMTDGKTYGRQMLTSFRLDTECFHSLTSEATENLKQKMKLDNNFQYLPEKEICEGVLNAKLYRLYLYHWLMNHPHVSRMPRLIVRWKEPEKEGLPLQVYAFITEGSLASFEWQQSQIIEHIVTSLEWFGLKLFQSPSGYDTSHSNVHLIENSSIYRKEDFNE